MKLKSKIIITISCFIVLFVGLHITPKIALRTHVFIMGHPKVSLTSNIKEDMVHKDLESNTTRFYILDKAPIDRATGNKLRSYKVEKLGFLYFAGYYGEV